MGLFSWFAKAAPPGPAERVWATDAALVTASLAKARAKLAETVRNPREAASMEAWFDANVGRQEG
jgi:hypothetical protein